jgi:hypothetical protein
MQRSTTLGYVLLFNVSDSKVSSQSDTIRTIQMSERCGLLRETPPYLFLNVCEVLTQSSTDNASLLLRSSLGDVFNTFLLDLRWMAFHDDDAKQKSLPQIFTAGEYYIIRELNSNGDPRNKLKSLWIRWGNSTPPQGTAFQKNSNASSVVQHIQTVIQQWTRMLLDPAPVCAHHVAIEKSSHIAFRVGEMLSRCMDMASYMLFRWCHIRCLRQCFCLFSWLTCLQPTQHGLTGLFMAKHTRTVDYVGILNGMLFALQIPSSCQ